MKNRFLYKLNRFIIALIFCWAIFTPLLINMFQKNKEISEIEKRKLSKAPEIPATIKDIEKFPKLFDEYYSDHFGLRDWFVNRYKLLKYNIGDSPSKDVLIGKDGWLFLGSIKKRASGYFDPYYDPIGDVRNINLYSKKDLINLSAYMKGLKSWLNDKGIEYVLVIVPNKHTVYFDKLPDYISKVNKHSATDQLIECLKEYTDVPVVDLRGKLINAKDKNQLYCKTDTHWNHFAANIAQYEIMTEIEKMFPEKIKPEIKKLRNGIIGSGDLAYLMGVYNFKESEPDPQPIFEQTCTPTKQPKDAKQKETCTLICEKQKLNAVIFGDSFFEKLEPYFSRKFKRSTYIWERLNYPSLIKYIELEKPDIVIEEWIERILPYVPQVVNEFNRPLNEILFKHSKKFVFSNDWMKLTFNQQLNVDHKNDSIHLISTENNPMVNFSPLHFKPNTEYILHIKMESSVKSTLQLFYSDANESGYPFSEKNSLQIQINKGDNDAYILLDYPNLGKYLRFDPIFGVGEVTIKTLDIKEVQ